MTISVNGQARVNMLNLAGERVVSLDNLLGEVPAKLLAMTKYFLLNDD